MIYLKYFATKCFLYKKVFMSLIHFYAKAFCIPPERKFDHPIELSLEDRDFLWHRFYIPHTHTHTFSFMIVAVLTKENMKQCKM